MFCRAHKTATLTPIQHTFTTTTTTKKAEQVYIRNNVTSFVRLENWPLFKNTDYVVIWLLSEIKSQILPGEYNAGIYGTHLKEDPAFWDL